METLGLMLVFFLLLIIGIPVGFAMFGAAALFMLWDGALQLSMITTRTVASLEGSSSLALPLFILAGELMNQAGITKRLFNLPLSFVGHIRGGLAHVNVLASLLFAGMSGASVADTAGLGRIEIKAMLDEGYPRGFSAAITAASSVVGPIIPPSIFLVLYAVVTEVSVGRLFLGGIVPGLLIGAALMIYVWYQSLRMNFPRRPRASWAERWESLKAAVLPLLAPVLIVGGIVGGVTTPTEAGGVACVYAGLLGVYYRQINLSNLWDVLQRATLTTVVLTFILGASGIFGWLVTLAQIPELVSGWLLTWVDSPVVILLLINFGLLLMGCVMSETATLFIVTPTLYAIAQVIGMDPVHMGVMMVFNLTLGLLTPPIGWNIYIVADIAELSFGETVKAIMPFLIPLLIALLIVTFYPPIVTWLPNLVYGSW